MKNTKSIDRSGRCSSIARVLITMSCMDCGNGDSVSYICDAFDRQCTAAYNDGARTTEFIDSKSMLPVR
mgnify:CR=1 FL=1